MLLVTDEELFAAALSLDRTERAELAHRLIVSLDDEEDGLSEAEWEAAWVAEAERRLQDVREGKTKEILAAEVFARARGAGRGPARAAAKRDAGPADSLDADTRAGSDEDALSPRFDENALKDERSEPG